MTGMGRTPPVVGRTDIPLAQQNLNYTSDPTTPPADKLRAIVMQQLAAGNTVDYVTTTLGFNELAALSVLPTAQALAMLPGTLATYQSNDSNVLTEVRSLLPYSAPVRRLITWVEL